MNIIGNAFVMPGRFLNDVNTDLILPGQYLRVRESELWRYAFAGIIPDFSELIAGRSILVAGVNFGCGSSREQAPKALLGCGVRLVIAESLAYIFHRNSFNLGLAAIEVSDLDRFACQLQGPELNVDLRRGSISDGVRDICRFPPPEPPLPAILRAGGILPLIRKEPLCFR